MPVNKDALLRYLSIHKRLKKSSTTLKELTDASIAMFANVAMSISPETIKKDIKHLRDLFDAPIIFDVKKQKYKYSDVDYQFLSVSDNLLERLINSIQLSYLTKDSGLLRSIVEFETPTSILGVKHIPVIAKSILNSQQLRIEYQSKSTGEETVYIICPLLLKENRNSWYVLAVFPNDNQIRTFHLGRIKNNPILLEESFKKPENFSPRTYFSNSIGITAQYKEAINIVLSFNPDQSLYLTEKPLHYSQEIIVIDDIEFRIKIFVEPTYELLANILSYGNAVKIISPATLVSKTKSLLEQTLKQYE